MRNNHKNWIPAYAGMTKAKIIEEMTGFRVKPGMKDGFAGMTKGIDMPHLFLDTIRL